MPVMTIKSKARRPSQIQKLFLQANEKASDLLEETSDRVLVVYDKLAACIYYESDEPVVKAPQS